jgi:hypothetical protein
MQDYHSLGEIQSDLSTAEQKWAAGRRAEATSRFAKIHLDDDAGRVEAECKRRFGTFTVVTLNKLIGEVCSHHNLSDYEAKRSPPHEFIRLAKELPAVEQTRGAGETGRKPVKRKRSTEAGEARTIIIAALTAHHKYQSGSCLEYEPTGVRELARELDKVSAGSVSGFFMAVFGSHAKYKAACRDGKTLRDKLQILNNEVPAAALEIRDDYSLQRLPARRRHKPSRDD